MPSNRPGETLVALIFAAIFIWVWAVIFKKAGYPWAMALLMILPCVNAFVILYFAFSECPIQAELARCSPQGERDKPTDRIDTMFRQASALEQRGEWEEAAKLFDILSGELRGLPGEGFAKHSALRIRQRHASS